MLKWCAGVRLGFIGSMQEIKAFMFWRAKRGKPKWACGIWRKRVEFRRGNGVMPSKGHLKTTQPPQPIAKHCNVAPAKVLRALEKQNVGK